jgi:DNA processing protein
MGADPEAYRSWLVLNLLPNIGRTRFARLVRSFGSADAVLDASESRLLGVEGVGPMAARSILEWRQLVDADAELIRVEQAGASLVHLFDAAYPKNLSNLPAPPPLLYYKGTLDAIDEAAVAVVGTRKISRYGRGVAEVFSKDLSQAGITVVSGLALGGDAVAHRAAIDAGGRTLAVLGNGLSHVYPATNRALASEIVEHGALLSEMPMDAEPDAGSFPQRNSIISGLSLGVLVVEAPARSGTLITARAAIDENRAVYAVPGDIDRVNSVGTNQLIQEGARLVTSARDILIDLRPQLRHLLSGLPTYDMDEPSLSFEIPDGLNPVEASVLEVLTLDTQFIDALFEEGATSEIPQTEILTALLNLELRGLIRQEPGKRFRRIG